jgi:transposase
MAHDAAIDVALEWRSVCVVDAAGPIVREARVRSERAALVAFFAESGRRFARPRRGFALKVGVVSQGKCAARSRARRRPGSARAGRRAAAAGPSPLCSEYATLHRELLRTVREDEVAARLMTIPGVGAVVAMTCGSAVDQPERSARSKVVGAHFGLTPVRQDRPQRPDQQGRRTPWCARRCSRRPTGC